MKTQVTFDDEADRGWAIKDARRDVRDLERALSQAQRRLRNLEATPAPEVPFDPMTMFD